MKLFLSTEGFQLNLFVKVIPNTCGLSYLITYVDSEQQAEEASGGVSSMAFKPGLINVFEKCGTVNQHLQESQKFLLLCNLQRQRLYIFNIIVNINFIHYIYVVKSKV